jgi:DNA-binding transcriptional LysR family regulator
MQTDALRVFFEAVQLRSIRKAAEKLSLAPSSVSRQIRALEQSFGTTLMDRSAKGVAVTPAGEQVAAFARTVMTDFANLRLDLHDQQGGRAAVIRIALVEGVSAAGPASAMARFRRRFPDVRFDVGMMAAPKVVEAVRRGDADMGVTFGAGADPDLVVLSTAVEPLVCCARGTLPVRPNGTIGVPELSTLALALPGRSFAIRDLLDQAARASGVTLTPVISSESFEILRDFATGGGGAAVLPARALRGKDVQNLTVATLIDEALPATHITVVTLRSRRLSRTLRQFQTELDKALSK